MVVDREEMLVKREVRVVPVFGHICDFRWTWVIGQDSSLGAEIQMVVYSVSLILGSEVHLLAIITVLHCSTHSGSESYGFS